MKSLFFAVATSTLMSTCSGSTTSVPTPVPSDNRGLHVCSPGSAHWVELGSVSLDAEADLLTAQVRYLGGCVPHELMLCWSGDYTSDTPRELEGFFVDHWDNDDACSTYVSETVTFDVSEIRDDFWVDGDRFGEDEEVFLRFVHGSTLRYDF